MNHTHSPLISIIVPVYKVEAFLDECVTSIINQSYTNLEIILVDDGSPDNSGKLCDEFALKDDRIKVIHKENGGLSDARNAGMAIASGDYIGFVDSDDFIDCEMYNKMIAAFSLREDIAIVSAKILKYEQGNLSVFFDKWDILESNVVRGEDFAKRIISQESSFTVWNKLYKSSVIKEVEFWKGRTNEDTLFLYEVGKILKREELCMMELPYNAYYYRIRPDSICTNLSKPLQIDVLLNIEYMLSDTDDNSLRTVLYYQKVKTLYKFLEKILVTPQWRLYYEPYKNIFSLIDKQHVYMSLGIKERIWAWLIIHYPKIRILIKRCRHNF